MLKLRGLFDRFRFTASQTTEAAEPVQAWVWSEYKAALPQSEAELEAINRLPAPMAWVWCHYRGALRQSAEEMELEAVSLTGGNKAVVVKEASDFTGQPFLLLIVLAVVFSGLMWLFQPAP